MNKKKYADNLKNSYGPSITSSLKMTNEGDLGKEGVYK